MQINHTQESQTNQYLGLSVGILFDRTKYHRHLDNATKQTIDEFFDDLFKINWTNITFNAEQLKLKDLLDSLDTANKFV